MSIKFKSEDCVGCGHCLEVCQGSAFHASGKYSVEFSPEGCLDCDNCAVLPDCMGECVKQEEI